ncbi:HipA domain-containing protein [Silanimonas sp.]|uniref:type II toxin-antitoxin system HipA family toxin n=1 Tax=Silanimonas sp. TaxID=1929290 RepID=UPI001BC54683|nr:HipA domain-containing protein [Silanimonas sp.]MBS3895419.1 type II toxin-antitoxin system HipA family toxin [Silanimonas sp.]
MRLYLWAPLGGEMKVAARLDWDRDVGSVRYAPSWLEAPDAYALDPLNLPLGDEDRLIEQNRGIPGVLSDAGPDRWGRRLMERLSSRPPRNEAEWVLATAGAGTGAIRASLSRSALPPVQPVYPQVTLEQIEEASRQVAEGGFPPPPMYEILCVQSGALGGARPKAAMLIDGRQVIAKFQQPQQDTVDVPRLEAACLALAKRAGIDAVEASVTSAHGRSVLLVDRFDRRGGVPLHYLSARSLLAVYRASELDTVSPGGRATYAAIAAAARRMGIEGAGAELFRRMAFNYAIGNTDDHLQNHGFLYDEGWRLAPAFDIVAIGGESLAIGAGRQGRARTRENLLSGAGDFGLRASEADAILEQAITAARGLGDELDRLAMPAGERAQVLRHLCDEAR